MKKIIVFFLFVALLAGCHDAYTPEPPPAFVGKVSAVIDGKPYETKDLTLIFYWPEFNSLSFVIKVDNQYLSFIINNTELSFLKGVSVIATGQPNDGFNIQYDKDGGYNVQKGEWYLESKEGLHLKANFWAEVADRTQTKTISIEGGKIDIVLPDRRYTRHQ